MPHRSRGLAVHRRRARCRRSLGGRVCRLAGSRCRFSSSPASSCSSFAIPTGDVAERRDQSCCRRPTAACWSRAPAQPRRRAARRVAADQHFPVADGRAREPRAGLGPRHARRATRPAGFCRPTAHDAATTNERSEIWIDHGGQMIVARQIVGMLARRVVCRAASRAPTCRPATATAS